MLDKTNGGFLVSKVKQIQGRVFDKLLAEHGIDEFNGAQGRILFVLWNEDGIPIKELSDKTGLAKNTLTNMLDRLEKSGHVQRVYDHTDRRTIRIKLTETAKDMKSQYFDVSARMNKIFYEGFSDDEITAFESNLARILENLIKQEKNI